MRLTLIREIYTGDCTIGSLYIEKEKFCDTLEPVDRGLDARYKREVLEAAKVKGETAIPTGEYKLSIDIVSKKNEGHKKYAFCNYKLPRLLDVPCFDGVLIHIGNFIFDTEGCILVGDYDGNNCLSSSSQVFQALYKHLLEDSRHLTIKIERA